MGVTIAIAALAVNVIAIDAQRVAEDVPVPRGLVALAQALEIDPPDRARCITELVRLTYADTSAQRARSGSRFQRLVAYFAAASLAPSTRDMSPATDLVPMPLRAAVWSEAVFHRPVRPDGLFAAVMSDRSAALLAHGLAALDDETLRFFAERPALLTRLYERDAPAFSAFAAHLRIRDNQVLPPGGHGAVPLWEAVLQQKVTNAGAFVRELFGRDEGRLAYLYDVIAHLDSARTSFALGLWIDDPNVRVDRFKALATVASSSFREWHLRKLPFARPPHDLLSMFLRVQITATGAPRFPASRSMWARAFEDGDVWKEPSQPLDAAGEDRPVDAAWIAETLLRGHAEWRLERLDQFAFGQRVFASANRAAVADMLVAIRTLPRFRMLMLTLERIGVERPSLYAALARQAERVSELDVVGRRAALAELQGAIALIARMAHVKTIDVTTADALLGSLAVLPFDGERANLAAIVPWLMQLRMALGAEQLTPLEDVLVAALAGPRIPAPARSISWEGQTFVLDLAASEERRLRPFRRSQTGPSIDATLDLYRLAHTLTRRSPADARVAAVAERLLRLVDTFVADALLSFSYAVDWTDSRRSKSPAHSAVRRHDFGLAKTSADARTRAAWALPRQVTDSGMPWHIQGAILGLDVALAPLALRRISADSPPPEQRISSNEARTFVTSVGLMSPFALDDGAQRAIAEAIARGRRRVARLGEDGVGLSEVIRETAMDGWRVRALRWAIDHEPHRIGSYVSMTDLLYLGGGRALDLTPWAMSAIHLLGCLCTHVLPSSLYTGLIGRPQLGLVATTVADLNLHVAVTLHELGLPAALARPVLGAALQEFLDRVSPSHHDDWLTLVRTAQAVSRERIEDYVAAAIHSLAKP